MKRLLLILSILSYTGVYAQSWVQEANVPLTQRRNTSGFEINGKGYVCLGGTGPTQSDTHFTDLIEYDPIIKSWSVKANFPGIARRNGIAVSNGTTGFVGCGWNNSTTFKDLYKYSPLTDSWSTIAPYPGTGGRELLASLVNGKIYVGGGHTATNISRNNDFWEYDILSDIWIQKNNFPFSARSSGVAININGSLYIGLGTDGNSYFNDFWMYSPANDTWAQVANFPGQGRFVSLSFQLNNKIIVGGGSGDGGIDFNDYYEYDAVNNSWRAICSFGNLSRGAYFSIDSVGYVATGLNNGVNQNSFWSYTDFTILKNDTTVCSADSFLLKLNINNATYQWSDGSLADSLIVRTSGKYWVDVTLGNCISTDTINVLFTESNLTPIFPTDTSLCIGDSINFNFDLIPNGTFLWSDSTKLPTNMLNQSGLYWLEISENSCISRDSFNLTVKESPHINLGSDTILCQEELIGTSNSNPNTIYLWNTGSNDTVIIINNSGLYWLETLLDGCIFRDSINITTKPTPQINLGADTTLCIGDSLTLSQSSFVAQYLWNDSSNLPSFKVKEAGIYWLNFTVDGCETRDSILIEYFDTLGASFLPTIAEYCEGDQLKLEIPLINSTYLWQDGSTDNPYSILDSGLYTVQISNTCGTRTDSVLVIEKCACKVVTQNSFSPNNDFINDRFLPQINCEVTGYSLTIYSRWGEKVFESNRSGYSWDGKQSGRNLKPGVYYYILKWAEIEGHIQTVKGNTLLLR